MTGPGKGLYLMTLTHPETECPALDPDKLEALNDKLKAARSGEIFTDPKGIELIEFFGKPAKHTFWALVRFPTDKPYSYYARDFKLAMGLRIWRIDEEVALDIDQLIPFFDEDIDRMRSDK
jgi:hypothetical protein